MAVALARLNRHLDAIPPLLHIIRNIRGDSGKIKDASTMLMATISVLSQEYFSNFRSVELVSIAKCAFESRLGIIIILTNAKEIPY